MAVCCFGSQCLLSSNVGPGMVPTQVYLLDNLYLKLCYLTRSTAKKSAYIDQLQDRLSVNGNGGPMRAVDTVISFPSVYPYRISDISLMLDSNGFVLPTTVTSSQVAPCELPVSSSRESSQVQSLQHTL